MSPRKERKIPDDLLADFKRAAAELADFATLDGNVDQDTREWLDRGDPVDWQMRDPIITADEFFFITTLYGNMNLEGQRTMIRKFFRPLFVETSKRDIRNFKPDARGYHGLRSPWMKERLCRMGAILRERGISMQAYVEELRVLEKTASPENPMPALDKVVEDHRASGTKTLSVFVRDCVRGNCFPIDLAVEKTLKKYGLPCNERLLVRMSLAIGKNPREVARAFYWDGVQK